MQKVHRVVVGAQVQWIPPLGSLPSDLAVLTKHQLGG